MKKTKVDFIEVLSPAISIEQKATSHNPRATVGTVTEIYDYLRLLYARIGTPKCPDHNEELRAKTVSEICDEVYRIEENTKIFKKTNINFYCSDITSSELTKGDLMFVRDCLVHFYYEDINN